MGALPTRFPLRPPDPLTRTGSGDILTTPARLASFVRLVFVTGNPGKLEEARTALASWARLDQDAGGYPEIQADSLEEVAHVGLEHVAKRLAPPFFLEDAGLFVDALDGFPGVYSAYVYKTLGTDGILRLLEGTPPDRRSARFQAVIGYRDPDHENHFFHGSVEGTIASQAKGGQGFGFDPIFIPQAQAKNLQGKTFAQLAPEEKTRLSHRGQALADLSKHLRFHPLPGVPSAAHEKDS